MPTEGEERAEFLRRLAGARALPSIVELERLWYEIVREMTDGGKVVKFRAPSRRSTTRHAGQTRARPSKGSRARRSVHREQQRRVPRLSAEPEVADRVAAASCIGRIPAPSAATCSRLRRPAATARRGRSGERRIARASTWSARTGCARIQEGEVVGYVIIAVGVLGVLLALFQAVYLIVTRLRGRPRSCRNLNEPTHEQPARPRAAGVPRRRQAHRERRARGVADLRGRAARGPAARALPVVLAAGGRRRSVARPDRHRHRHDHHVPRDRGVGHERSAG